MVENSFVESMLLCCRYTPMYVYFCIPTKINYYFFFLLYVVASYFGVFNENIVEQIF